MQHECYVDLPAGLTLSVSRRKSFDCANAEGAICGPPLPAYVLREWAYCPVLHDPTTCVDSSAHR